MTPTTHRPAPAVLHVGLSTIQGDDLIAAYRERMHALFSGLRRDPKEGV